MNNPFNPLLINAADEIVTAYQAKYGIDFINSLSKASDIDLQLYLEAYKDVNDYLTGCGTYILYQITNEVLACVTDMELIEKYTKAYKNAFNKSPLYNANFQLNTSMANVAYKYMDNFYNTL